MKKPAAVAPTVRPVKAQDKKFIQLHELIEPYDAMLVVKKPLPPGRDGVSQTESGLFVPDQGQQYRSEFGLVCQITKCGPAVSKAVAPGDTVLIAQYAGLPIYAAGNETEAWLINESDVLAKLDPSYWEVYASGGRAPLSDHESPA